MRFLPKRPLYRYLTIIGALVGIALVGLGGWSFYARNSYSGRLAAIRAAGDPASISDLAPKRIPADQDAAAQLVAVAARIDAFANEHGRFLMKTPLGKAYDERPEGEPGTAEQLTAIREIVEKYSDVDAAIARAAECDGYASRLNYSLPFPQFINGLTTSATAEIRTIARFVRWQMELETAAGNFDQAVVAGIEVLRLAKLYEAEPGLVSRQLADAVRYNMVDAIHAALTAGDLSSEVHDRLDSELARHDDLKSIDRMFKTERAINISGMESQLAVVPSIVLNTIGLPLRRQQTSILDFYDQLLPTVTKPWHEAQDDPQFRKLFKSPTGLGVMADLLQPGLEMGLVASNRSVALIRSLRIFSALHRFENEQGRKPSGLADLDLPAETTIDPFSGKPLIVNRTDGGWLIYSVMKDGKDDGGDFTDQKDWGVGPPSKTAK